MPRRSDPRARLGARNNADWCAVVARAHGIDSSTADGLWRAAAPTPPGYPEAVTLEPGLDPHQVVAALPPGATSLKDSFADLELAPFGFRVLFEARWIALDGPSRDNSPAEAMAGGIRFERVTSAAELAAWAAAHGNPAAFVPPLLADPAIVVLGARRSGEFIAGAALNGSEGAVGVSNVFGPPVESHRAAASNAARRFPGRIIVGWEPEDELAAALAAGFDDVGPLRVWVR